MHASTRRFEGFQKNRPLPVGVFEDDSALLQLEPRQTRPVATQVRQSAILSDDRLDQDILDEMKAWEL